MLNTWPKLRIYLDKCQTQMPCKITMNDDEECID